MSDWDFLHDMHNDGYSPEEIADAAFAKARNASSVLVGSIAPSSACSTTALSGRSSKTIA